MTTARHALIAPGTAGRFHCVQRCVRRAFLCGTDHYTSQSFDHRKDWIEQRLLLLADCFAVAIHAYAVMSNHLHVVLQFDPAWQASWSDLDVATRWGITGPDRPKGRLPCGQWKSGTTCYGSKAPHRRSLCGIS